MALQIGWLIWVLQTQHIVFTEARAGWNTEFQIQDQEEYVY